MARQILPIAGQIIGGMVGGPVGAAIGGAIGSVVGNAIDPQVIKGPKLGDGQVQTSAEGVFRPIVLGTGAVMGNIIHRGPEVVRTHRQRQSKGGGPKTEEQRRYRTFAIRVSEGPIAGILRIWMDEKLVYDIRPESTIPAESAEFASRFRLYLGDEEQLPDPDIEAYLGIGNVNAYRGTAYVVFPNFDLTDYGDRIPQFRFEVASGVSYGDSAVYIALDRSGSMNEITGNGQTRWANARTAVVQYLDYISSNIDAFGRLDICLVLWGGLGSNEFYRQSITRRNCVLSDIEAIKAFIPATIDNSVATSFRAAVADASDFFDGSPESLQRTSVFITDGRPTYWNGSNWVEGPIADGHATEAGETLLGIQGLYAFGFNIDLSETGQTNKMDNTHHDGVPVLDGSNPNELANSLIRTLTGFSDTLQNVISFLHTRVGQGPADYSPFSLPDSVDGIVLAGDYTAADCIRTLMPVFMFDASEHDAGSGYRINYVKRGGPVVATITADDLVGEPEESVREDALERPKKLHLHFQSPTVGYAPAKATSMRNSPDVLVTGEVSASVPVVFSDVDEAWRRAGVMHQVAWSEVAGTQELVLSDAWLELVPTDNIGLVLRDQQRRLRITKIEHVEGTLKFDLMTDRQSSYTSNLTGIPLPEPTPPPPSIVGPTVFAFLDIPALTDTGDRLLYYVGVSGQTPAWYGAVIQRSLDGGANYEDVLTVQTNTIMGALLDPISSASEHYTDTTNVVRVQLFTDDEIQSLTQQQFLSEGGAFALEKPGGGWEVMQYRDADDEGDGVFALTTLLRGRLNSGPDEHLPGARFVLLDGVYAIDAETSMIGHELTHRAVSLGTSPELGTVSTDTYTAQSQTEWPVAHILSDGVDSGSLPVQIIPRHRFGTEDHPVSSINWQGFRITATDGSNTVTIDTLSDTHTFSVGGWSDPITVTASQLNRFTGAGPSVSEEFE